ncbi:MAG TPA: hypothetical protein VFK69_02930 [Candidatus Eisenbacteria bacterium]|jgi:hypothetical protein|nr:hypothetical protein [Candidatus Eisenbacteria bacterium]
MAERRMMRTAALAGVTLLALAGCGPKRMLEDPKQSAALVSVLGQDSTVADPFYDKLVASDNARRLLIARMMANGSARQDLLFQAARDRTLLEGMLNVAVQDTVMRDHVFALVRGMEMMQPHH